MITAFLVLSEFLVTTFHPIQGFLNIGSSSSPDWIFFLTFVVCVSGARLFDGWDVANKLIIKINIA